MRIEGIKLIADENKKITDNKRSFYSDCIYLSKNDNINNYEEVGYEVWGQNLIDPPPLTEVDKLKEEINNKQSQIDELSIIVVDLQYELLLTKEQLNIE